MKKALFVLSFLIVNLNLFSQDSVVVYLDDSHQKTVMENATFIRKALHKDNIYSVTEAKVNGPRIFYCELLPSNLTIEQGKAIYYNDNNSIYSTGEYTNGEMTGKWLYYKDEKSADTIDYSFTNHFDIHRDWHSVEYFKNDIFLKSLGYKVLDSISSFINANFHLPGRVKADDIAGISLWIDCIIDSDGRIKFAVIKNSAYRDVDKEVSRILNQFHYDVKTNRPFLIRSVPFYYEVTKPQENEKEKKEVFVVVKNMPEFPGGDSGLLKFISENLNYPEESKIENKEGKAIVKFRVSRDGSVDNVIIVHGVDPLLDQEAVRVINLLPHFKPGKMKGKPVNVWYTIPINFSLK
jgi:TonB family protein